MPAVFPEPSSFGSHHPLALDIPFPHKEDSGVREDLGVEAIKGVWELPTRHAGMGLRVKPQKGHWYLGHHTGGRLPRLTSKPARRPAAPLLP